MWWTQRSLRKVHQRHCTAAQLTVVYPTPNHWIQATCSLWHNPTTSNAILHAVFLPVDPRFFTFVSFLRWEHKKLLTITRNVANKEHVTVAFRLKYVKTICLISRYFGCLNKLTNRLWWRGRWRIVGWTGQWKCAVGGPALHWMITGLLADSKHSADKCCFWDYI
jgi:hypothetical protein